MAIVVTSLVPSFLIGSSLFLQVKRSTTKAWMGSKFGLIRPWTLGLAALERLKKSPYTYNGRNVVTTLVLSNLNRSYSFLQIRRTTIKARMSLNFVEIPSPIKELAVLEHLKIDGICSIVMTTLAPSFLIGSSSFLQPTRTTIKAWMSLNLK